MRSTLGRVVVAGASLGGVDALQVVPRGLERGLPAPIIIAQHLAPAVSRFEQLLSQTSRLPVERATDGARTLPGSVYLCPARSTVCLCADGSLTVRDEGRTSSAAMIDDLFRSAAAARGEAVLAVVLTGLGSDGTAGARAVRAAGGGGPPAAGVSP